MTATVIGTLLLLAPADALAAAPTLASVGLAKRHPTASWTLPPGVESDVIEVAMAPDQASDGGFFEENVVEFDTLRAQQATWVGGSRIKAGRYYIHVKGYVPSCFDDPACEMPYQWSNVLTLVVPKATRLPTSAERRAMLVAVKRIAPPFWRSHLTLTNVRVSNYAPWARAVAAGVGRWAYKVQAELFAFKRLAGGRWRPYLIHQTCPVPGMPREVMRELQLRCFP